MKNENLKMRSNEAALLHEFMQEDFAKYSQGQLDSGQLFLSINKLRICLSSFSEELINDKT